MDRWWANEGATGICPRGRALRQRRGRLLLPSVPADRNWIASPRWRAVTYDRDLPVFPAARIQPVIPNGSDLFLTPAFVDGNARL